MTWTKLGDEFPAEARDLTSDEVRLHIEALCWSNKRLLDLLVPKRDLRRLSELDDPHEAAQGLVDKGWWEGRGDVWFVGVRFPEWQQDRAQVEHRREQLRIIQDRKRKHARKDHSLCLPGRCPSASPLSSGVSSDDSSEVSSSTLDGSGRGFAPTDPLTDQSQTPSQDQTQNRRGTTPRTPRGQPPSSADRATRTDTKSKPGAVTGGGGDTGHLEAAPAKEGCATNSQNQGVRHASESTADDAQRWPNPISESTTTGTTRGRTRDTAKPAA